MSTSKRIKLVRGGLGLALTVGLLFAVGLGMASAAHRKATRVRQAMSPTGKAPEARGRMLLVVRAGKDGLDGAFDVAARHLAGEAKFDVLIGGVKVGELSTNGAGSGRSRFRTRPSRRAHILGVDPRGKRVVVRDHDGDDILEGDCHDDEQDAGKIACCVPDSARGAFTDDDHHHGRHRHDGDDDHGHHGDHDDDGACRRLSADDCAMVGGSSAGGSCLPDPCTTTPPPGTVCCEPEHGDEDDDEEVECKPLTPDRCASRGGTMVSAPACDPNPCQPTPSEPRIACCTPDDGELECHHRTAAECAAHQGVDKGAVSCDPNPCGGGGDDGGHRGDD